jgi:hypothetical protein
VPRPVPHDPETFPNPAGPTLPNRGRLMRVTDEQDGDVVNRGYAYWSQAFVRDAEHAAYVIAPHSSARPRFFKVDLVSGSVERLGPLVEYIGEGGDWYWNERGELYVREGPRLHRLDPLRIRGDSDDVVMDINDVHPGCRIWQPHSADDGRVHSATVERPTDSGPFERVGTVVFRDGRLWHTIAIKYGTLDESQISANGRYLVIKEGPDPQHTHNRIFDLERELETFIAEKSETGGPNALGHSDMGRDFIVGEDNQRGACMWMDLADPLHNYRELFATWGMGNVSVAAGRCLHGNSETLALVDLQSGVEVSVLAHGMRVLDLDRRYDYQPNANLDRTGRVVVFASTRDAHRIDLYLYVL